MKKIKKLVAIVLAAATVSGAGMLAACSDDETSVTNGVNGKSAYEIAVDAGFKGTEAQWLESLKGANGSNGTNGTNGKSAYEIAVEGGYTESEAKWLESLKGANGSDGGAGKSAYQIAVDGGYTGTEAQWLESLKGATGATGGTGKSAYEIAVDNGFEGTEEEWLESLKGDPGLQGSQGVKGEQGLKGDKGEQGERGTQWFTGRGLPGAQNLEDAQKGDFYINMNTNTIYVRNETEWEILVNVNEKGNVSKWDGRIPGWQAPNLSDEEVMANRPVSYVVNEESKTVDLYNAEAFAWFAYRAVIGKTGYAGYTVTLHCDVDLDNKLWIPIGLGARSNAAGIAFRGTFDGNGHTIYNLNGDKFLQSIKYGTYSNVLGVDTPTQATGYYINYKQGDVDVNIPVHCKLDESGDEVNYGLFGNSYNATFKNLNIENVTLNTTKRQLKPAGQAALIVDSVGALLGYGLGNLTVENCHSGNPDGSDGIKAYTTVAGLVGRVYAGTGENEKGIIDGKTPPYGKIKISDCKNYINTSLDGEKLDKVAGIVAFTNRFSEVIIENCHNYGNVTGGYAGGIMGYSDGKEDMASPVSITGCSNHGDIRGNYAGGLFGYRGSVTNGSNASYTVNNFVNHGNITAARVCYPGKNNNGSDKNLVLYAGGIGGSFTTTSTCAVFTECFNHGNVTIENAESSTNYAGGMFGYLQINKTQGKKQGSIIVSGISMGDVTGTVKEGASATVNVYGCGFVKVPSEVEVNKVYKQIYFFNSGLLSLDETPVTGKENTNLSVYAASN